MLAESDGLGLPKIAVRIEYSMFAASEPNGKLESKVRLKSGSGAVKGSAGIISITKGHGGSATIYVGVRSQVWTPASQAVSAFS